MLKLYFFGPPRLECDARPVRVDTRKALALAAYLALTRTAHSRDALAALFYPDSDAAHARAALRRTLSSLKQALGAEHLDADRELVALDFAPDSWVDVHEFNRLLDRAASQHDPLDASPRLALLTEAVELYRADLLAGFTLRDSPAFDEWQFFESETLRRRLASALEQLVDLHIHSAPAHNVGLAPAIAYARRWLALDPLHEPAHRQLMLLYAWDGQRAAALRQYRECVRLLEQELGVAPLEETTQLYHAIEEHRLMPPAQPTPTPTAPVPAPPPAPKPLTAPPTQPYPLVGRAAELALLLDSYAAIKQSGRLLVVHGEPGIGKTRLAEEFLAIVRASGANILAARCYPEQQGLAYGPLVESLRAALAQPYAETALARIQPHVLVEAARLLPELAARRPDLPPAPPLADPDASSRERAGVEFHSTRQRDVVSLSETTSPGAQARFLEGLADFVEGLLAGPNPGVLFTDDAQWLDSASLDLLALLVRRLPRHSLALLLTWRIGELPTNHLLYQLLAGAERAGVAAQVRLGRLSPSAVQELVRAAAGQGVPLQASDADRLYRESEGQPFFLVEFLKLLERQDLPSGAWSLPSSIRDLLRSRLARVDETGRQLLGAAAVIGRSFGFETLRQASGRSEDETIRALESLIAQGLITETAAGPEGEPVYDFIHDKLRDLIYEETSLARRRLLHRRVAQALAHPAPGRVADSRAAQIAQHYQAAGMAAEAADYFRRAGDDARALFANRQAVEHYRTALALGHPETHALHAAIGDLYTLLGEYSAALTAYEAAAAFSSHVELSETEHKIGGVYLRRREWELAENHLQTALDGLPPNAPPAVQARILADLSLASQQRGQDTRARSLAQRALKLARSAGDTHALAQVHNLLGILARMRGELDVAVKHLEASLQFAPPAEAHARSAALNNLALVLRARGDALRAVELTEQALALALSRGDRHRAAALHNNLADLLHELGRAQDSLAHLKQAVAIYAEIGIQAGEWQPEIWKLQDW